MHAQYELYVKTKNIKSFLKSAIELVLLPGFGIGRGSGAGRDRVRSGSQAHLSG